MGGTFSWRQHKTCHERNRTTRSRRIRLRSCQCAPPRPRVPCGTHAPWVHPKERDSSFCSLPFLPSLLLSLPPTVYTVLCPEKIWWGLGGAKEGRRGGREEGRKELRKMKGQREKRREEGGSPAGREEGGIKEGGRGGGEEAGCVGGNPVLILLPVASPCFEKSNLPEQSTRCRRG